MSQFLDLVALGTVADVVPLDKNNRILVHQGMERIRQGKACAGIQALLTVGKRNPARLCASDLGFAVGPRLNAAGRLDDMSVGIECLLCDDPSRAMALAEQLDSLNKERREVEQGMQADALATIEQLDISLDEKPSVFVLYDEGWHQGIVGLVASRIKERTSRPVVALAPGDNDGEWKGSARSLEGIHIRDVFARLATLHPGLMKKFGGHAMAAGLSIDGSKLEEFQFALVDVMDQSTQGRDWSQTIWTDGELTVDEFNIELADQVRLLTPWGQGFLEPLFDGYFDVIDARAVGEIHAKLKLQPRGSTQHIDAICFSYLSTHADLPSGEVRAVYKLDVNEFRGQTNLQLMVQHIE
jgi:single-stranded-DNA-specific exonuclease